MSPEHEAFCEELEQRHKQLPRHSQVFFLYQCIQRIEPLYGACWMRPTGIMHSARLLDCLKVFDDYVDEGEMSRDRLLNAKALAHDAEAAAAVQSTTKMAGVSHRVAQAMRHFAEILLDDDRDTEDCLVSCLSALYWACNDQATIRRTLSYDIDGSEGKERERPKSLADAMGAWPFGKPSDWPSEGASFASVVAIKAHKPIASILKSLFR